MIGNKTDMWAENGPIMAFLESKSAGWGIGNRGRGNWGSELRVGPR
jgi:hypothetical protein